MGRPNNALQPTLDPAALRYRQGPVSLKRS